MSFFDRRKHVERRSDVDQVKENTTAFIGREKRTGNERRSWKDRRMDRYHQMELSKRKAIYQIIEMLEKDGVE